MQGGDKAEPDQDQLTAKIHGWAAKHNAGWAAKHNAALAQRTPQLERVK